MKWYKRGSIYSAQQPLLLLTFFVAGPPPPLLLPPLLTQLFSFLLLFLPPAFTARELERIILVGCGNTGAGWHGLLAQFLPVPLLPPHSYHFPISQGFSPLPPSLLDGPILFSSSRNGSEKKRKEEKREGRKGSEMEMASLARSPLPPPFPLPFFLLFAPSSFRRSEEAGSRETGCWPSLRCRSVRCR